MRKHILFALLLLVLAFGLAAEKLKEAETFEVSPNPMYRYTVVYLNISRPMHVSIRVEDDRGNLVKTIFSGLCEKSGSFTWLRDKEDGSYAPNGEYYVVFTGDGRYTSTKKTLILK